MRPLVLLVALAIAAPASAAWRRVDTPNFIVVGDASARELRSTAAKFEAFHEVLRRVLPAVASSAPVPTVVIVFSSDEAFARFKPTYQGKPKAVSGYAVAGLDVNLIAMVNAGEYTEHVIFHEYTHMVVANAVARIPLWLNEGLAEFYSTFALMKGGTQAQIGRPIVEHLRRLNGSVRVPLVELLRANTTSPLYNEDSRLSDFYAESWALTHMLLNGATGRVAELTDYLQRVNSGTSEVQAWEEVFGTQRTETDLRRYVTRPTFSTGVIDFADRVAAPPSTDTLLSPAATAAFLASLLLRSNADGAAALLTPALRETSGDTFAEITRAQIDLARHDAPGAAARVMALGPIPDWFSAYSAALTLIRAASSEPRTDAAPALLAKAAALLAQVRRDRAELPNVLASLARIALLGDDPPPAAAQQDIARARALAPGRVDYALTQAELYATAGDFARARSVVGPMMTPVFPAEVRDAARRLMGELVDLERRASGTADSAPRAPSRSVSVADANHDRPRPAGGVSRTVPSYRVVQAGEQRLEGVLERIDCSAAGRAVFHVRAAGADVQLEGSMPEVQFITYRDDLTGGVRCGPRDPMRIYVTWREPSGSARERTVVAVEFLPRE